MRSKARSLVENLFHPSFFLKFDAKKVITMLYIVRKIQATLLKGMGE